MEKIRITGTIKTADSLAKRQSVLQAIFLCIPVSLHMVLFMFAARICPFPI